MTELKVQKVPTTDDRRLPIFAEFERLADRVRLEAYNLFARRGSEGRALDDWLEGTQSVLAGRKAGGARRHIRARSRARGIRAARDHTDGDAKRDHDQG